MNQHSALSYIYFKKFIGCFLLFSAAFATQAQQKPSNPSLFVHFDKTIYTNNEMVWFTGYLLRGEMKDLNKHSILSVALVRDIDSAVIKQDKYLMVNGLSLGSMVLPDSMITGNYHFQATTNRISKGLPEVLFMQPIVIKTNIDAAFNASIKLLNAAKNSNSANQVVVTVTTKDARFLPEPVDVTYKYGRVYKNAKTNTSGELLFSLDEQADLADPNVYAKIKYGKDSSFINMPIPVTKRKALVKFYPEGGQLVDEVPGFIAWEVRDQQGATVDLKATLYENDKPINTIESNAYGIGKFMLNPKKSMNYSVKLSHTAFADSTYYLPAIVSDGIGIQVKNAVTSDTLTVILRSKIAQTLGLQIKDADSTFLSTDVKISKNGRILKIPLNDVTKGLKTITFSDSLNRPLAERMFFAHYNTQQKIIVSTDQQAYNRREKVTLKLKLNEQDTLGMVSIACVQDNRMLMKFSTDIESYVYLNSELGTLPIGAAGRPFEDKPYLENVLLVKGWRKYTWQNAGYDSLAFHVAFKKFDKTLKKPIDVSYLKEKGMGILQTDSLGTMTLSNEILTLEYGKKMFLVATAKNQGNYNMEVNDPYVKLNKQYAKLFKVAHNELPAAVYNNNELALKSNEKAIRLREVMISGNEVPVFKGPNACGDYVCLYNILNCRNHTWDGHNTLPVAGRTYKEDGTNQLVVYKACEKNSFLSIIDGVYTKKEFYVNDFADPLEPALVSTLYWNAGTVMSAKEKEIIFYTGDIPGKFRIVVQGITDRDVIFGQHDFEVKENKL
ncbi:hypothetical protein [Pedobacter metabolipauper]|uniref:MG2 domain-containing protein n=1 Tax=Pedobacter metabolipauper TaxID=425513 RepID=A0A4R6SVM2_9SPHI|nr:hypothetical protein [Pedobacter metabolipauper]TDQ08820.1 hypothetical protein ATK78_3339 [Pedobacter metabolipauper]